MYLSRGETVKRTGLAESKRIMNHVREMVCVSSTTTNSYVKRLLLCPIQVPRKFSASGYPARPRSFQPPLLSHMHGPALLDAVLR